jgi:hypothetical protein
MPRAPGDIGWPAVDGGEWLGGTPERKQRAREALAGTLARWMASELVVLRIPQGDSEGWLWGEVIARAARASELTGRWSEFSRHRRRGTELQALSSATCEAIVQLAVAVIALAGGLLDTAALLQDAEQFLAEVDDEDDGVMHCVDALATLVGRRWDAPAVGAPGSEQHALIVGALAPLLAQDACVRTRIGAR